MEMIAERDYGLGCDVVTRQQVQDALKRRHPMIGRRAVDAALSEIGAIPLGQHRIGSELKITSLRQLGNADKPSLWAIRNVKFWAVADHQARVEEYLAHESRLAALPDLPGTMGVLPMSPSEASPIFSRESEARLSELAALLQARWEEARSRCLDGQATEEEQQTPSE
jgi:hypothetical protein